ncbi:ComF family protein [Candidimonas sp. SYP-B2681]|uniref:ComF family protein n=1 Tax=Candidimonas sp. SYP-B2681 TaxID=2497686 RepID=UPI000F860B1C|nr:ComF family protein [Candidimonas sp. SYP-B2681]RTZ43145.1 ComF family protein [Candidimonas sp. SYP-B2681]
MFTYVHGPGRGRLRYVVYAIETTIMADMPPMREYARHSGVGLRRRLYLACRAGIALVPTACVLCQGSAKGGGLCANCAAAVLHSMQHNGLRCPACCLALGRHNACPDCCLRQPAFDRVIAAFDYAEPGDLLIHYFKVGRRFTSAGMLAGLLARTVRDATPALPANTILVPVPASRSSIIERGFNPAAEVARSLARQLDLSCRPELLLRVQEGSRQTRLNRTDRLHSVQSLYACPQRVAGAAIAVVDDVLTTGSTLHSIAQQFKAAGAASVLGLVLARTPYIAEAL